MEILNSPDKHEFINAAVSEQGREDLLLSDQKTPKILPWKSGDVREMNNFLPFAIALQKAFDDAEKYLPLAGTGKGIIEHMGSGNELRENYPIMIMSHLPKECVGRAIVAFGSLIEDLVRACARENEDGASIEERYTSELPAMLYTLLAGLIDRDDDFVTTSDGAIDTAYLTR